MIKKLYSVKCDWEVRLYATDQEEAERLAIQRWPSSYRSGHLYFTVKELNKKRKTKE